MSFDADRSSIMYTKELVLPYHISFFKKNNVNFSKINSCLDIGSNRGYFSRFILSKNKNIRITAVETRKELIKNYKFNSNVKTYNSRYEIFETNEEFDFIYNVHTLEHLTSCCLAIQKMKKHLSQSGQLFIAVPNINSIHNNFFEEVFIDPHTFQNLTKLKLVQLYNNKIRTIDPQTFKNLINLESIHLEHNFIKTIDPQTFNGLTNLKYLNLQYNHIRTINPQTFKCLNNLKLVDLKNNPLKASCVLFDLRPSAAVNVPLTVKSLALEAVAANVANDAVPVKLPLNVALTVPGKLVLPEPSNNVAVLVNELNTPVYCLT
jgi:2-polyprenyl-3-methyl-5-hydroxy-6-metoxy-1,4-benzoquinol methylase